MIAPILTHAFATFLAVSMPARLASQQPVANETDLAISYARLERAVLVNPPGIDELARFNQSADGAMVFFSGRVIEAIKRMDDLSLERLVPSGPAAEDRFAIALRGRVVPDAFITQRTDQPVLQLSALYDVEAEPAPELTIRLRTPANRVLTEWKLMPDDALESMSALPVPIDDPSTIPPSLYLIEAVTSRGLAFEIGRWTVLGEEPEVSRGIHVKELTELTDRELAADVERCLQRNVLLDSKPTRTDVKHWMIDRSQLAADLEREVEQLSSGQPAYRNRPGFMHVTLEVRNSLRVPTCIVAPDVVRDDSPLPVVVALHGAGGNEFMFIEGYAGGRLVEMARDRQFLLVSPVTYPFVTAPKLFEPLINSIGEMYPIDRSRIYVMGHSLGAMATARIATECHDLVRACAIIAGGSAVPGSTSAPPAIVYAAEFDSILSPVASEQAANDMQSRGRPVEFELRRGYGHILIVSAVLNDCVQWLFRH